VVLVLCAPSTNQSRSRSEEEPVATAVSRRGAA
jgi:hypothetical protein